MNLNTNTNILNFDSEINYFKEDTVSGYISIPNDLKSIKKPLSLFSDIHVNSVNLFQGESLVSNEGQILTGFNLLINYSIKENLKYVGCDDNSIFFFSSSEIFKYCYLVLPPNINNVNIEDIIYRKLYSIHHCLENVELYSVDDHTFYYHNTILFTFYPHIT